MITDEVRQLREDLAGLWPHPGADDSMLFLVTEVGELADAIMRMKPGFVRNNPRRATVEDVAEEAADVLIMLATVCMAYGIDLDGALQAKCSKLRCKFGRGM